MAPCPFENLGRTLSKGAGREEAVRREEGRREVWDVGGNRDEEGREGGREGGRDGG